MKILFLHLSDLHINSDNALSDIHFDKLFDALRVCGRFDQMFLIFSGDIAFSGDSFQYDVAKTIVAKAFRKLKSKGIYNGRVHVLCVPGNHDIKYENPPRSSEQLNEIFRDFSYAEFLDDELKKQSNFFEFANINNCFMDRSLFDRKVIDLVGFSIEVNLINSAVFSLMKDEDKGLHYINQNTINELNTPSGADFAISVIHHAPEWYIDSQKHQLETALLCKSSLIFAGHEHWSAIKTSSYDKYAAAFIHCGGSLSNDADWSKSEFETGVLDTDNLNYHSTIFRWNANSIQYEVKNSITERLPSKPSIEKQLEVSQKFKTELFSNSNRFFSDSPMDYFVFPRIEKEVYDNSKSREFLDVDAFIKEITAHEKVVITGGNGCGKTSLLKALFISFIEQGYYAIYCDINTIKNKDSARIVKTNFEDIYGDDLSAYNRFNQIPREKKVLIIDDIDQIKPRDFERYISEQSDFFGLMIFSTNATVDLDMLKRMETALGTKNSIVKYKVTPYYSDKRKELVEKLVSLRKAKDTSIDVASIVDKLCESIKLQKKYISLTPEFLITFVEYYCKNIGTTIDNDSSVFSKAFESSITSALSEHKSPDITVEKLYRLLSMIAHYIHFNKKYPISESEIISVVDMYNTECDDVVRPLAFLETIKNAEIIGLDGNGYRFRNRNHLAYFCAREVNYLYNDTGDERDLKYLVNCCCFGINADILMFISYITDNKRILRLFLDMTEDLTNGWEEFDFEKNCPGFLSVSQPVEVEIPNQNAQNEKAKREIEIERENNKLQTIDIYDYKEEDAELIINQIIRAMSLLTIISKCLPGFEHNMNAKMRGDYVREIYTLPNKIYYRWAKVVDSTYNELIQELRKMESVDYSDHSAQQKDEIEVKFKLVAALLLLDIYSIGVNYATKDNSFRLLDKSEYDSKTTYAIEKLMMIEKQKNSSRFVNDSISLYEHSKGSLPKFLIKNVAVHAYVNLKSLDFKMRDQLNAAFFQSGKRGNKQILPEQKTLLLNRAKNANKD